MGKNCSAGVKTYTKTKLVDKMITSCKTAVKGYILKYANHCRKMKILDVGCGDGEYTSLFSNENEVIGLDLEKRVLPQYRNFKFIKGNAEKLPFPDNTFDLVISFDVLEHIFDDQKALQEMFRVLRKEGEVFLETPNKERLSFWMLYLIGRKRTYPLKLAKDCIHLREYTKEELRKKFLRVGFRKIKILPFWLGIRGKIDFGIETPPPFLERFCQCWFIEAQK